jgi:hypothetical protein
MITSGWPLRDEAISLGRHRSRVLETLLIAAMPTVSFEFMRTPREEDGTWP